MEILKKYLLTLLVAMVAFSCVDPLVEKNEDFLSGEWVIEEIFVDLDIPPSLIEDDVEGGTPDEIFIPEELLITQVLYDRLDGVFVNDVDFRGEVNLASTYTLDLNDDGLYTLEVRSEFFDQNIMEYIFQFATPSFIQDYFPGVENYTDLGNGDYEYYNAFYSFNFDYSYFSNSSDGTLSLGIWETVNLGEQVLFDYTDPLYEEGSNLWDIEIIDDNNIVLTQFGETNPRLSVSYIEELERQIDGVLTNEFVITNYSNLATIFNASIVLRRK